VELKSGNFALHINRNDIPCWLISGRRGAAVRMMAPAFVQAAAQLEPDMRLAKLNTEEARDLGHTTTSAASPHSRYSGVGVKLRDKPVRWIPAASFSGRAASISASIPLNKAGPVLNFDSWRLF